MEVPRQPSACSAHLESAPQAKKNFGWRGPKQQILPKENNRTTFGRYWQSPQSSQKHEVARTRRGCSSASPVLASAGAAASAAATRVPAAVLPCVWLARRPDSCSNALAQCSRRVIMKRSPCLHGVCCASAQPSAAERRLTLTGVNSFRDLHTSFPIDPEVIQSCSAELFYTTF